MTHEKKQPKVKAKGLAALKAVEEAKKKGMGHGDGGAVPPVTTAPSGRGRGCAPSSVKSGKGVPGKGESHCKNNPFSALATATKMSAGAVKRKLSPQDLGSAGKAIHKQLPAIPLKKKSTSTGAIKKPHRYQPSTVAFKKLEDIRRAPICCVGNCVWPDWSERSHKTFRWICISRQLHCWSFKKPWRLG